MAQSRVTEFFSVRKRSFDLIQPSKKLRLDPDIKKDVVSAEHRPSPAAPTTKARRGVKRKETQGSSAVNIKDFITKAAKFRKPDVADSGTPPSAETPPAKTASTTIKGESATVGAVQQVFKSNAINQIDTTKAVNDFVSFDSTNTRSNIYNTNNLPKPTDVGSIMPVKSHPISKDSGLVKENLKFKMKSDALSESIVSNRAKDTCNAVSTAEKLLAHCKQTVKPTSVSKTQSDLLRAKISRFKASVANAKLTDKPRTETPAHECFNSLAQKEEKLSLILPFKYRLLLEMFRAVETVVSMLYNRKEICTFDKLQSSVQQLVKRAFNQSCLGQIKTVFPTAYNLQIEKNVKSYSPAAKNNATKLTITPNLAVTGKNNTSQMNPSILLERRKVFSFNLLVLVKKHHQDFLANLSPPMSIPSDQIMRWHPRFPIDNVPDIPVTPLPEIQDRKVSTAQDVLNKMKGIAGDRIDIALQSVVDKNTKAVPVKTVTPLKIASGALKGISQAFLQKIQAKESAKIARDILRKPETEKRIEMMSRLPKMVRIIRHMFVVEKRAAIALEDAKLKICDSYDSAISPPDADVHLKLLSEILPRWLIYVTISKGVFLKIDKNLQVADLLETIEIAIQKEKS